MDLQFGDYILSRLVNGRQQTLALNSIDASGNHYLTFQEHGQSVRFDFVNIMGHTARFLVTGKVYFMKVGDYYLFALSNDVFLLSKSSQLLHRLFLFFPKSSQPYTTVCNLNGHFFIHRKTLDDSVVASFNSHLTDQVFLQHKNIHENAILAKDCSPNCTGKKCTDSDGCGLPCGCPQGKTCLSSGECGAPSIINVEPKPSVERSRWPYFLLLVLGILLLGILIWFIYIIGTRKRSQPMPNSQQLSQLES